MMRNCYQQEKMASFSRAEAYLEPSRTSTIELFLQKYGFTRYFCKKSSIVDIRLGSKHASGQSENNESFENQGVTILPDWL